jgi:uncharacterized membrane protein YjgN (DUF898 family)
MTAVTSFDAAPPADPPPARPATGVLFSGVEDAFWRLLTRGAVLLLVTLGVYRFWLQTDVRRFLWNNTEIAGENLEYIGTARELLLGFLVAIVFLGPLYAIFGLASLAAEWVQQLAGLFSLVALAVLGQFAVYRARRYRLSRTVYRGIRFHQTGSAWRYAICAIFWWGMIGMTLGLAYPWAQASLERFKIRNTYYGDLRGEFAGSGTRLFFRGVLLWFVAVGPFVLSLIAAGAMFDGNLAGEAAKQGTRSGTNALDAAGTGPAAAAAILGTLWLVIAIAALYPAFQAMVLRWWISGLRFGELTATSHLRTSTVYGFYWRFVWMSLVLALVVGIVGFFAVKGAFGANDSAGGPRLPYEVVEISVVIGLYVVAALAYSTIYQATVKLPFWRHGFESVELKNVEVLDRVRAAPATGSPVGEGFADALHVGGI